MRHAAAAAAAAASTCVVCGLLFDAVVGVRVREPYLSCCLCV